MAKDPVKLPDIHSNNQSENFNDTGSRKNSNPNRLPPLNQSQNEPNKLGTRGNERNDPNNQTQMSENSKRILRWHLWWDKTNSELRIPTFEKPRKDVDSKIGSLQNITHKPSNLSIFRQSL